MVFLPHKHVPIWCINIEKVLYVIFFTQYPFVRLLANFLTLRDSLTIRQEASCLLKPSKWFSNSFKNTSLIYDPSPISYKGREFLSG